jgi:hypothetical protein
MMTPGWSRERSLEANDSMNARIPRFDAAVAARGNVGAVAELHDKRTDQGERESWP